MERYDLLFVCGMNAHRSAAAEAIARPYEKLYSLNVRSAGLAFPRLLHASDAMQRALARHGYSLPDFEPKKISAEMMQENDLVLCMTLRQQETLGKMYGKYSSRIFLLGEFAGNAGKEIRDPEKSLAQYTLPLRNFLPAYLRENIEGKIRSRRLQDKAYVDKVMGRMILELERYIPSVMHRLERSGNISTISSSQS